jgi:hypothetical protein
MSTREDRTNTTRDMGARRAVWQQPGAIPQPIPQAGVRFKWVRKSMHGDVDVSHMSSMIHQGWVPTNIESQPTLKHLVELNAKALGTFSALGSDIEIGGLILMQIPEELAQQRDAHYRKVAKDQITTVDNNLMQQENKVMPLYNERATKVTRGGGFGTGGV